MDLRNRIKKKHDLRHKIRGQLQLDANDTEESAAEYFYGEAIEQIETGNINISDDIVIKVDTTSTEEPPDTEHKEVKKVKINQIWTEKEQRTGKKRPLITYSDLDDTEFIIKSSRYDDHQDVSLNREFDKIEKNNKTGLHRSTASVETLDQIKKINRRSNSEERPSIHKDNIINHYGNDRTRSLTRGNVHHGDEKYQTRRPREMHRTCMSRERYQKHRSRERIQNYRREKRYSSPKFKYQEHISPVNFEGRNDNMHKNKRQKERYHRHKMASICNDRFERCHNVNKAFDTHLKENSFEICESPKNYENKIGKRQEDCQNVVKKRGIEYSNYKTKVRELRKGDVDGRRRTNFDKKSCTKDENSKDKRYSAQNRNKKRYRKRPDNTGQRKTYNEKPKGNRKQHGQNITKPNRNVTSDQRLFIEVDFTGLLTKDQDEVAVIMGSRSDDLEHYLWKKRKHNNIKDLVKLLEKICHSDRKENKKKILYLLMEKRFFTREDVTAPLVSVSMKGNIDMDEYSYLQSLLAIAYSLVFTIKGEHEEIVHFVTIVNGITKYLVEAYKTNVQAKIEQIIEAIKETKQDTSNLGMNEELNIIDKEILPSIEDIRGNEVFSLKRRPIGQPFENSQEYLSHMFYLFREDFVRPLKKGIREYIEHIEDQEKQNIRFRHDDIRIFENVQIIQCECNREDGLIWKIHFDVSRYKRVNWSARSLLQYGTLVCLSCDGFTTIVYATVARRNPVELKEGKLQIMFLDIPLDSVMRLTNSTFVMIECKTSYVSYALTLNAIRGISLSVKEGDELPFSSHLVYMHQNVNTPKYLQNNENTVNLGCISNWDRQINILNESERPNADMLSLDESQHKALYLGLTKKLALIQGPPGTGKTVIGLKITNVLLNNLSLWQGEPGHNAPLLILSYTNHALDQFLEEILNMSVMRNCREKDLVRVGCRTDSLDLEKYNLSKRRREILENMNMDISYFKLNGRWFQHEQLQEYIKEIKSGLLHEDYLNMVDIIPDTQYNFLWRCKQSYSVFIEWLNIPDLGKYKLTSTYENDSSDRITITEEYSDTSDEEDTNIMSGDESESEPEFQDRNLQWLKNMNLIKCKNVDSLKPWFAVSESILFPEHSSQLLDFFRVDNNTRKNIIVNIQKKIHIQNRMSESEAKSVRNVWCLSMEDRWRLYRHWIYMLETKMRKKKYEHERSYERAQKRYKEARVIADVTALRSAKVVGMTTTRAARDIEVLRKVGPKIIILEEAAEIPEHHALACISPSCQHLIMIGDHQQLRPAYNDYHLSKEFNTNISLFERLIRGKLPFCQLTHQHRMRPEISKLLTPHIYRCLTDHESVLCLTNIRGIATNLFFISHTELENRKQECESKSHVNEYEANFVSSLYGYLRIQGYRNKDITILTTYKDQMRKIKKIISEMDDKDSILKSDDSENDDFPMICGSREIVPDRHDFKRNNVRVTVVDNFQGEENKIIILSLVRSNIEERIGYLKEANRICVALSRAKNGLFVIGNFSLLKKKSPLWRKILFDAERRGHVGDSLLLCCQKHPNNETPITKITDFAKVKDGGCNQPCKYQKDCGHVCDRLCHPDDENHERKCMKECKKPLCNLGHRCTKLCFEKCGLCMERVARVLPRCGHEQSMYCSENVAYAECKSRCEKTISCGHQCQKYCGDPCNTASDCFENVKIKASCGHEFQAPCCTTDNPNCTLPCETTLECGHICKGKCSSCSQKRLHVPCNQSLEKTLICGHVSRVKCSKPCLPCQKNCDVKCSHRDCNRRCGCPCINCREDCEWKCNKNCPNGFKCDKLCYELCERPRCNVPCNRPLKCKHICPGLLCETCPQKCLTCNEGELTEIFFGNEDEWGARFIQLEDCSCVFELQGLDHFMDTVEDENLEISRVKRCPKCRTVIQTSKRYGNILKLQRKEVESIHRIIENKSSDFEKRRRDLLEKRIHLQSLFEYLENSNKGKKLNQEYIQRINSESDLILVENLLNFLNNIDDVKQHLDRMEDCGVTVQKRRRFLRNRIVSLSRWVFEYRQQFSTQELEEFRLEMTRISVYADFLILLRDIQIDDAPKTEQMNTVIINIIEKLETVIKIPMIDLENMKSEFDSLRKTVPEHGVGISKKEQIMIIKAMKLPIAGHWYKCKNGHFYAIGECGGAVVEAKCPHCDVIIGGADHFLNADNARATEMEIQLDD